MSLSKILHETERFAIVVDKIVDPDWEGREGYVLINKETMVREGETNVEVVAIRTMRDLQEQYDTLTSPETQPVQEDEFEDMIKRMQEQ